MASFAVQAGVALGIGMLIGLERERSESAGSFAGVRTLPLVALLGAVTYGFLPELLVATFVVVSALVVVAYAAKALLLEDPGTTTAFATLLTFAYGAMTVHSEDGLLWAVVLGTLTAAALSFKEPAHGFVEDIGEDELRDTMKFLIVALVVFPLLPNQDVELLAGQTLNPRFVWLMVVLVSGISLGAYLLTKYLGARKGIALSGLLGGMASSTATTLAMTARARREVPLTNVYAFAIAVASMAMFPRVLIEVGVVNRALLPALLPAVTTMMVVGSALAYLLMRGDGALGVDEELEVSDGTQGEEHEDGGENTVDTEEDGTSEDVESDGGDGGEGFEDVDLDNPFQLRPALAFGAVFAVILLATDVAAESFGDSGVYATAVLSGFADADAITLSLSRLALEGSVSESTAVTGIVIGVAANTLTKFGLAAALGTWKLGIRVGAVLVTSAASGIAVAVVLT